MRRPEDRRGLDPYEVLGVGPGAGPDEITAAYREQAKRWHPDRAGAAGSRRMAEINAAYELLRAGAWQRGLWPAPPPPPARGRRSGPAGSWLAEPLRRALGRELLQALEDGEEVALVTPAATWASPRTLLAVTDRRLLWLLDDAPTHRVRSLRFDAVEAVEQRRRRPLRRVAVLRLRTTGGRALSFTELRPATAAAVAGLVTEGRLRLAAP